MEEGQLRKVRSGSRSDYRNRLTSSAAKYAICYEERMSVRLHFNDIFTQNPFIGLQHCCKLVFDRKVICSTAASLFPTEK